MLKQKMTTKIMKKSIKGLLFFGISVMLILSCEESNKTETSQADKIEEAEAVPMPTPQERKEYEENIKIGEELIKNGSFEEGVKYFNLAAESYNSKEVREKIANGLDLCYKKHINLGKSYLAEKNYIYAKKEFETSRLYQDTDEAKKMIQECIVALRDVKN